ncbi:hypothetical protein BGY98DRAFT_992740 [Russula aff. rugulosa BPL654]|nr:hypothetical protein BGY98DRAFT_992740 [Russula aff. rugulosa BPL654]
MFDASEMYPKGYHPVQLNRSLNFKEQAERYARKVRPPRYYLIDFGLSRQYSSRNALDPPLSGGDKSASKHRHGGRCNPFRTDIYYLGNLVREHFILYNSFEFMRELIGAMADENPAMRPTIEEVIENVDEI